MRHEISRILTARDVRASKAQSECATIVACGDSRESFHAMIEKIATVIPKHTSGCFVR